MARWPAGKRELALVLMDRRVPLKVVAQRLGVTVGALAGIRRRHLKPDADRQGYTLGVRVDDEMWERIDKFRGRVSRAQAVRELIEWGLEAHENGLP